MASYDNQSLARGFKILDCLYTAPDPLPVAEVARRTGLHRATVHRLLTVLLQLGYVHKNPASALYSTAFYLHTFGYFDHIVASIRRHAAPFLKQLSCEAGGERVVLGFLDGVQVGVCDIVPSAADLQARGGERLQVGARLDAHASALGKVLMAYRPVEEIRMRYANHVMTSRGPKTVRSPGELLRQLTQIRQVGYVTEEDESAVGMAAIAAPIINPAGRVTCAVGLEGLKGRIMGRMRDDHIGRVVAAAARIADYLVHSDSAGAKTPSMPRPRVARRKPSESTAGV